MRWLLLSLCALSARASAEPLSVGLVPISGSAPAALRAQATVALAQTLSGLEGVQLINFAQLGSVLGEDVQQRLAACEEPACYVRVTDRIRSDRIVAGTLDQENSATVLRLSLLRTSTTAPGPLVRLSRQLEGAEQLKRAISEAALELLPELAKRSFGTLVIVGALPGSQISIDGALAAEVPLSATQLDSRPTLKLRPGEHAVQVKAPGHRPFEGRAEVLLGQTQELEISLSKNRSWGPLIVGGLGVLAASTALAVGLSIRGTAQDWEMGCPGLMACQAGFTRQRYLEDQRSVDRGRFVVNSLYGVAGAAVVGAILWFFLDPGSDVMEGS